jgi:hypothetical protein
MRPTAASPFVGTRTDGRVRAPTEIVIVAVAVVDVFPSSSWVMTRSEPPTEVTRVPLPDPEAIPRRTTVDVEGMST